MFNIINETELKYLNQNRKYDRIIDFLVATHNLAMFIQVITMHT